MKRHRVAIERVGGTYPARAPFLSAQDYPELCAGPRSESNRVFDAVRKLFVDLQLDQDHLGTREWSPFRGLVERGQTVFIKPNMVDHEHRFHGDLWSVVTHPSVVWAVAEYVALALRGGGRVVVGDNPHVDCRWSDLSHLYAPDLLGEHLHNHYGVDFEFVDLRDWHVPDLGDYGYKRGRERLAGDSRGTVTVDIGRSSMLEGLPWWLLRGTYHERAETIWAHTLGRHRYTFSRSVFDSDVLFSIPKLKTHAKVGATLNIKGLVGTIADKNELVHWRIGFPLLGGDEYPPPRALGDYVLLYAQHLLATAAPSSAYYSLRKRFKDTGLGSMYRRVMQCEAQRLRMLRGAWEGNDTTWRMAVDVYRALVEDCATTGRSGRFFSVVDGGVGGDTDGPHFPHARESQVLLAGEDLVAVDVVALRLMDLRLESVRYLDLLARAAGVNPTSLELVSGTYAVDGFFAPDRRHLGFRPPHRWPKLSLSGVGPGPSYLPLKE